MCFGRSIQTIVLLSLFTAISFSSLVTIPEGASAYMPHDPILIHGNGEFTAANGVTGGSGTPSDPYIIEGWKINAYGIPPYDAIRIDNTNAHFIIRNVSLSGKIAINFFLNVENGIVENSVLSGLYTGIFVARSNNFTFRDSHLSVSHMGAQGIFVTQSTDAMITGNTIVGTTVEFSGQMGIFLLTTSNITVTRNHISRTIAGMALWVAYDTTVTHNVIPLGVNSTGIIVGENSENTTIVSNIIFVPTFKEIDILLDHSKNNIMVNNMMSRGGILIIGNLLEHWNTHVIGSSNTVIGKPVRYMKNSSGVIIGSEAGQVILANCSGAYVDNLDFTGVHAPVQIGFSNNNTITRNHVHTNYWGMTFYFSNGNRIMQNTYWNNTLFGIFLENSTNNEIADNIYHENRNYSINLWRSSDNRIRNNTISFSFTDAILLWKSDNNTILENVVLNNNGTGIHLRSSKYNRIHHNSIIGNNVQAEDDLCNATNEWDDGYPSGGNYWSDYIGIDSKRGPSQDQPGGDGIGDTPYPIAVDNQDTYPLMFSPQMPPPQPPQVLEANLVGMNSEDVTITWLLSDDDGTVSNSVTGYEVYRNTTYELGGWGYGLIASLPNRTTDFVDSTAGEGDPSNYFYKVCAVDVNGMTSCGWNQAGKFTQPVWEGLNLLSIPLIQSDESIETVLQTVEFDRVWTYDSISCDWRSYMVSKPYKGELRQISHRIGFWADITEESNLTVAGIVPNSTMLFLKVGWNLVPFPSFRTTYTVSDLKAGTGVSRVEGLDSSSPPYFLRVLANWETMQAGSGYWVRVENDRIWTVDSS